MLAYFHRATDHPCFQHLPPGMRVNTRYLNSTRGESARLRGARVFIEPIIVQLSQIIMGMSQVRISSPITTLMWFELLTGFPRSISERYPLILQWMVWFDYKPLLYVMRTFTFCIVILISFLLIFLKSVWTLAVIVIDLFPLLYVSLFFLVVSFSPQYLCLRFVVSLVFSETERGPECLCSMNKQGSQLEPPRLKSHFFSSAYCLVFLFLLILPIHHN